MERRRRRGEKLGRIGFIRTSPFTGEKRHWSGQDDGIGDSNIRDASDGHYNDDDSNDDIAAAQTRGESGAATRSSHLTLPVAEAAEAQVCIIAIVIVIIVIIVSIIISVLASASSKLCPGRRQHPQAPLWLL